MAKATAFEQLKLSQHYAKTLRDSGANPFACGRLIESLNALEKSFFPASQKKKPASQDDSPQRV